MGATTTAFKNLLKQLQTKYPELTFSPGDTYRWSATAKTVYYDTTSPPNTALLLHEAAHGILCHDAYERDVELLKLERAAWTKAEALGAQLGIDIAEETRENALDSYRDWLHTRSLCPVCQRNGIQTTQNQYECPVCAASWTVNEARTCGLRRTLQHN